MTTIQFTSLPSDKVQNLRANGLDAYAMRPERSISDGEGNPCRHCLMDIPKGAPMLTLAYRPFRSMHPYAETGPIFLCAEECLPWQSEGLPPILTTSSDYLLKGYTDNERICYGTGKVIERDKIEAYAASLFERPEIAFVDVRSSRNNCFQLRIIRA